MSSRKTVYLKQLNQPSLPVMWGKLKVLPEWREKIEFLGYVPISAEQTSHYIGKQTQNISKP